jgi:hypothetical protein
MAAVKPRNLFLTQTGLAAICSIALSIGLTVAPIAEGYFTRRAQTQEQKDDIADIFAAIQAVSGLFGAGSGLAALNGRYKATKDLYTPDWMGKIGRNIEEVPANLHENEVSGDNLDNLQN